MFATAYQQKAAEYQALCFQAFNIAHLRIDEIILVKTLKAKARTAKYIKSVVRII